MTNKKEKKDIRVSARITKSTESTLKKNNINPSKALEMLAGMIENEKSIRRYEYDKLKYENEVLTHQIKTNKQRMEELKKEMSDIDDYDPDNPQLSQMLANIVPIIKDNYEGDVIKYLNSNKGNLERKCKRWSLDVNDVIEALNQRFND